MTETLTGLFIISLLSATLLPGSSEAVLAAIVVDGRTPVAMAVIAATLGNTAGSAVNWAMGRFFVHLADATWFPLEKAKFERYQQWYNRWGIWSLLASWMPVIGDPLTVMAGIARTPLWLFTLVVLVAKAGRYMAVAGLFSLL